MGSQIDSNNVRFVNGILEKGWYLGDEPIITRAEAQHYDNNDVVVKADDLTMSDLGIFIMN